MLAINKTHQLKDIRQVTMISAWGFTMVFVSFLFLYVGYLLDGLIGTSPSFMLGFFILGMFLCMMRLYQEASSKRKDL